jgi:hypothetical protein
MVFLPVHFGYLSRIFVFVLSCQSRSARRKKLKRQFRKKAKEQLKEVLLMILCVSLFWFYRVYLDPYKGMLGRNSGYVVDF